MENFDPTFESIFDFWEADGSLRDIYVFDTAMREWETFLDFASQFECQYTFDGELADLPPADQLFADRSGAHLLAVRFGAVAANCHFFVPEEIELDIDPREIRGRSEHQAVIRFIRCLSVAIGKPAVLTPENSPEEPYMTFEPRSLRWTLHG